jgi:2-dehydro-3-deoxyphosphooctonate aldolase (KDO 8-P synthase)
MIIIAGPCVIDEKTLEIALELSSIYNRYAEHFEFFFKASYDKANRSCMDSYRGPGLEKGLKILKSIQKRTGMRLTTDVHSVQEVSKAALVVDMIQIPALLSRQTDMLVASGKCGRHVNIKKGQFAAPGDMVHAVEKVEAGGCKQQIYVTERGSSFGYNRLVVDMLSIPVLKQAGLTPLFDCTHSLQLPAAGIGCSASQPREYARTLALAATAAGAEGLFFEVYPEPDKAKCDGANSIRLDSVADLIQDVLEVKQAVNRLRLHHPESER